MVHLFESILKFVTDNMGEFLSRLCNPYFVERPNREAISIQVPNVLSRLVSQTF